MNKVAAIIVTYNRCELLLECIDALKHSAQSVDILIIDNASTDNTAARVGAFVNDKDIRYFNTGKNIGGAGGFNYGIRKAYELGYSYFWLMDDDTIVRQDTLSAFFDADEKLNGRYGFLSSMAYWIDGKSCLMNRHQIAIDWAEHEHLLDIGLIKIAMGSFVSFFIKRSIVEEFGLPIKEYFIWGDDYEYATRISAKYESYMVIDSKVTHKMANNLPSIAFPYMEDENRIQRMFYSIRNEACTYRRMGLKQYIKYHKKIVKLLLKTIISKAPCKKEKIKVLLKGYFAGVCFHPPIEKISN